MANIITKTVTKRMTSKIATNNREQIHVAASSTTEQSQIQNNKFYSYARHSREESKSRSSAIDGGSSVAGFSVFSRPYRRKRLGRHQLR